jgi:Tfp pilus assembly protein PilO
MRSSARPIVAILVIAAAAIAFWTLAYSPKHDEADKLAQQVEKLSAGVETARGELARATVARHSFPTAYRQLVELGQAVPASDETPSLLVELEGLAARSGVRFESIQLEGEGEVPPEVSSEAATGASTPAEGGTSTGVPAAETLPATEVEASLLPLGASIGPAGLAVMPYSLEFKGNFFGIADFIGKLDALVKAGSSRVSVDGRLLTISGFSLTSGTEEGAETAGNGGPTELQASFSVTTYLTPPGQGITAGATPTAPASEPTSQTVAAR